jgi:hypothetical protein
VLEVIENLKKEAVTTLAIEQGCFCRISKSRKIKNML